MAAHDLQSRLQQLASTDRPNGWTIGELVDQMEVAGFEVETIEQMVWAMMAAHQLIPVGMVARRIRMRNDQGKLLEKNSYELLLKSEG